MFKVCGKKNQDVYMDHVTMILILDQKKTKREAANKKKVKRGINSSGLCQGMELLMIFILFLLSSFLRSSTVALISPMATF